jgi:DNA-binding PadR family transcriptional regulator
LNSQDVILGLLQKNSLSGYEIKHYLETWFSYFFDASFGTIYPTLGKMEMLGYITKENIHQENRPNKNVYTITDTGRAYFKKYLQSEIEQDMFRSDFMVRLFFGRFVERETAIDWVTQALTKCELHYQNLEKDRVYYEARMSPTQLICIEIGMEVTRAKRDVLIKGLTRLRENKET